MVNFTRKLDCKTYLEAPQQTNYNIIGSIVVLILLVRFLFS